MPDSKGGDHSARKKREGNVRRERKSSYPVSQEDRGNVGRLASEQVRR